MQLHTRQIAINHLCGITNMSFADLCEAIPSIEFVTAVRFIQNSQPVWCSWEQFVDVVKDFPGNLSLGITVIAEDMWWVKYYYNGDHYYSEWQVHRVPEVPDIQSVPKLKDLKGDWWT